jgi:hypothetical protein
MSWKKIVELLIIASTPLRSALSVGFGIVVRLSTKKLAPLIARRSSNSMPDLEEMIREINERAKEGAWFICIHMEPHLVLGPFFPPHMAMAEAFIEHIMDKWPGLEAHLVHGHGVGHGR